MSVGGLSFLEQWSLKYPQQPSKQNSEYQIKCLENSTPELTRKQGIAETETERRVWSLMPAVVMSRAFTIDIFATNIFTV